MKKYYEAYNERYKAVHEKGYEWSYSEPTSLILDKLVQYKINHNDKILEIGCGEGRDSIVLIKNGYNLKATDISKEAIDYCINKYKNNTSFEVLDVFNNNNKEKYKVIFAVAVLHMFVIQDDRDAFFKFIHDHLEDDGIAIILTMGGKDFIKIQTNPDDAFNIVERLKDDKKFNVTSTSCMTVSEEEFKTELNNAKLKINEMGYTSSGKDFESILYAAVSKCN